MDARDRAALATQHACYARQARWFYPVRSRLLRQANIGHCRDVLDLGCGTGIATRELRRRCRGRIRACDVAPDVFHVAPENFAGVETCVADARDLPLPDTAFDLVLTQMFFLWAGDVPQVLREVRRVLRPGGRLIVAAEPDYGGRVEHPEAFALRDVLIEGLHRQGADPFIGRKLRGMLLDTGFQVQSGVHASFFERDRLSECLADEFALAEEFGASIPDARQRIAALIQEPSLFLYTPYFHFLAW